MHSSLATHTTEGEYVCMRNQRNPKASKIKVLLYEVGKTPELLPHALHLQDVWWFGENSDLWGEAGKRKRGCGNDSFPFLLYLFSQPQARLEPTCLICMCLYVLAFLHADPEVKWHQPSSEGEGKRKERIYTYIFFQKKLFNVFP